MLRTRVKRPRASTALSGFAAFLLACQGQAQSSNGLPVATVEDAIGMTRIQYAAANKEVGGPVAAISPDGSRAVIVVWRGDLARNVNVYTLMLFDLQQPLSHARSPIPILSRDFVGDLHDQLASPFLNLEFLGDNRTLVYLGRDAENLTQAFTVDVQTKEVRQLTHNATPVRSFVVGMDGELRVFSAVAQGRGPEYLERITGDGVFPDDPTLFPRRLPYFSAYPFLSDSYGQIRQYFLAGGAKPTLLYDSRQSGQVAPLDLSDRKVASSPLGSLEEEVTIMYQSSLTADPRGRRALLFPYATDYDLHLERYPYYNAPGTNPFMRRVAAPYGLIDLKTGRIERLLDAPHPQFEVDESGDTVLWAPDGASVIIYTLLPDAPADPPQWVEVNLDTRKITPLKLPKSWRPLAWTDKARALLLKDTGNHFGMLHKMSHQDWGFFQDLGAVQGFDPDWTVASNGRVILGVKNTSLTPPELVAYDLGSKRTTVLSDFNPSLHRRRYGEVQELQWATRYEKRASGFLIKPVDYQAGKRYPLVILLDDGNLHEDGRPFMLDGVGQLGGHAVQMLAADGFMVLYPRQPHLDAEVRETPREAEQVREQIESAIAKLDHDGLIDPQRVGISGWSRAAYYTDYLLIHSTTPFAAATAIDGGGVEYNEGLRPFTDAELQRIRAPVLVEPHSLMILVYMSRMTDRMAALGKPTEILYFSTATHATTRPQHRLRSLGTHIDWWRFWLQGYEDPDRAKATQYQHWEALCELQKKNSPGSPVFCPSTSRH